MAKIVDIKYEEQKGRVWAPALGLALYIERSVDPVGPVGPVGPVDPPEDRPEDRWRKPPTGGHQQGAGGHIQ